MYLRVFHFSSLPVVLICPDPYNVSILLSHHHVDSTFLLVRNRNEDNKINKQGRVGALPPWF